MTQLYLVRHGETDWNRQRRIQGRTDIPLNDTGRTQARETGLVLAARSWDGVFASPLARARETADIIAAGLGLAPVRTVAALVERDYGEAEGLSDAEVDRLFPDGVDPAGRETREQVAARVVPALIALAQEHPGESLVVVSHGGAIRSVLNAVDPDGRHGPITNGSVHSFRLVGDELRLIAFDDPVAAEGPVESLDEQNAVEAREDRG